MMTDNIVMHLCSDTKLSLLTHLYNDTMLSQPCLILYIHREETWSSVPVTAAVVIVVVDIKMGGSAIPRAVCCLLLALVSCHAYNYSTFFNTQWVKLW